MSLSCRATRRGAFAAAGVMVSLVLSSSPARADKSDNELALMGLLLFGVATIGGTVSSVGTQAKLIDGTPDRDWATASYGLAGLNGAFAVGFLIAGAVVGDEPALYVMSTIHVGLGIANLIPALITSAVVPAEDPGIPGRPRPGPTSIPLLHLQGTF
jgi:membrane-associated protease RseP (regulator of RpoE activity)